MLMMYQTSRSSYLDADDVLDQQVKLLDGDDVLDQQVKLLDADDVLDRLVYHQHLIT
jgi:hypothetical protein